MGHPGMFVYAPCFHDEHSADDEPQASPKPNVYEPIHVQSNDE